ncbi:MAG: LysR family transcriptional regulator [Polyangiaceae bacterium]|nr:LysR family transcriptional regulator [Polyangiaceae bacterium]
MKPRRPPAPRPAVVSGPGDLNAVAAFVKVVEAKGFRAAARALGVPTSTLSLRVARLEEGLGTRLLARTTRTVRLTEVGEAYYRHVAPAVSALRGAERFAIDPSVRPAGRLRVTAPLELGQLVFGDVGAELLRRYPEVELHVELLDRKVDLVAEGFDLALRAGKLPDSTLVARKLGAPQRARLYASPAYLERRGEPRRPSDLVGHDCLVMSALPRPNVWPFRGPREAIEVEVRARASANSFLILRRLAEAGHGVARLPELRGAAALRAGTLRAVLDAFCPPPVPLHAVYPSARHVAPKVRALLELLEEHFAAPPSWLAPDPG